MDFPSLEDAGAILPLAENLESDRQVLPDSPVPGTTPLYALPGPARKQNVACDACRAKKVRCHRQSIEETCSQCASRGVECTSEYIEGLIEKQKQGKQTRKSTGAGRKRRQSSAAIDGDSSRRNDSSDPSRWQNVNGSQSLSSENVEHSLSLLANLAPTHYPPTTSNSPDEPSGRDHSSLYRYLFSPYPVTHREGKYTDHSSIKLCKDGHASIWEEMSGAIWSEEPSAAHLALSDSEYRSLAEDFANQFFRSVHPRYPLLDERDFQARLGLPDTTCDVLPDSLLAVVIAFGAKFSAHQTISEDRAECSTRHLGPDSGISRSRLVQLLAIRAREVVEVNKCSRVPTLDNCQTLFFMELLYWNPYPEGLRRTDALWRSACQLALQSEYNTAAGQGRIKDPRRRAAANRIWHALSLCDGLRSIFGRFKVVIDDEDIQAELPVSDVSSSQEWIDAARTGAVICRSLAQDLYPTRAHNLPISLSALRRIDRLATEWAKRCLPRFGMLEASVENWDRGLTMTACSIDLHYHTIWLIVQRVVERNGIREDEASAREPGSLVEDLRRRCADEAEHAALRITALTALLLEDRYLQGDPLNLFHPIYEAGRYLAQRGREESLVCAAGIKQIAVSFGQLWSLASELEQTLMDSRPRTDDIGSSVSLALGEVTAALQLDQRARAEQHHMTAPGATTDGSELVGLDFGAAMPTDPLAELMAVGIPPGGLPYAVGTWLQQAPQS